MDSLRILLDGDGEQSVSWPMPNLPRSRTTYICLACMPYRDHLRATIESADRPQVFRRSSTPGFDLPHRCGSQTHTRLSSEQDSRLSSFQDVASEHGLARRYIVCNVYYKWARSNQLRRRKTAVVTSNHHTRNYCVFDICGFIYAHGAISREISFVAA